MVVAVVAVRMVEVVVDEVVDVITVGNSGVTASLTVGVLGFVLSAVVPGGAAIGMCVIDCDDVLVDVPLVRMVQMSVVQVVDVVVVHHRDVPAARSVLMGMIGMDLVVAHALECRSTGTRAPFVGSKTRSQCASAVAAVRRGSVSRKEAARMATAQSAIVAPGALSAW